VSLRRAKRSGSPVTENIILVIPDQPQKAPRLRRTSRQDDLSFEYLSASGLLLKLYGAAPTAGPEAHSTAQLAKCHHCPRHTGQAAVAEKIIRDIDKAKPEVVVQSKCWRRAPIACGTWASSLGKLPRLRSTRTTPHEFLDDNHRRNHSKPLRHLHATDYVVTLPSLTATPS